MDETDRLIAALDIDAERRENERRKSGDYLYAQAVYRALRLTSDLELAKCILRGERVPVSRLDAAAARAYGLLS